MHIAAINGYVDIVGELASVDCELCRLKGKDMSTPLHLAAIKGRVDIISVLLLACPQNIEDVNVQRETALHLGVKNNQFQAVEVLLDWIREIKREDVLNIKDELGNTVLHIAARKKQRQVIELLLGFRTTMNPSLLEVNATNNSGLTALDVLLIFPSEAGDGEITDFLCSAGAMKVKDMNLRASQFSPESEFRSFGIPARPEMRSVEQQQNLVEYCQFKEGRDSPSKARSALLVIAVLVATATFRIGVNPPGGFWKNTLTTNQINGTGNNSMKPHTAGESIMATSIEATFRKTLPRYFSLTFVAYVVLHLQKFMDAPASTCWLAVRDAVRSTTFLSAFVGIFQGVICLHRKVASKDHKLVYWIAGGMAALSVLLEKNSRRAELALYVLPRAGDSLWYILVNRHLLPNVKNSEVALFSACMGGIMYYLEYEPETMAPFLRGLIRSFLASRISNPGHSSNRNASYTYLQTLDAIKKPKVPDNREVDGFSSQKCNLEAIPGL